MFKKISFILLIFVGGLVNAQVTVQQAPIPIVGQAFISGQIVGVENQTIHFGNQNIGGVSKPLHSFRADKDGKFKFTAELPYIDYYFLKFENNQILNLILHGEDSIKIFGDMKNILQLTNFVGSEESEAMNQFLASFGSFKAMEDSLKRQVRVHPEKGQEINSFFQPLAENFYKNRNNFIQKYSTSPAIVVTVNAIDQEKEWDLYQQVVGQLEKSYPTSPTIKNIRQYVDNKNKEKEAKKFLLPGNQAKEIALPNPEGDTIKLSDLKGKVVLIDFWASWCRPCRMENPNVVNMYNKYGAEGFTVYSVSLDNNKDRWKQAIEQDGLVWPNHVSDLKKWSSSAAKDYLIKSIPFTVLIDKEGNVVGTNLRGAALENQLKTIFGH